MFKSAVRLSNYSDCARHASTMSTESSFVSFLGQADSKRTTHVANCVLETLCGVLESYYYYFVIRSVFSAVSNSCRPVIYLSSRLASENSFCERGRQLTVHCQPASALLSYSNRRFTVVRCREQFAAPACSPCRTSDCSAVQCQSARAWVCLRGAAALVWFGESGASLWICSFGAFLGRSGERRGLLSLSF